jgi:peptidoglycan/xylan/chitin deacetylase (PgdA/CDA1 family)
LHQIHDTMSKGSIPILIYHAIGKDGDAAGMRNVSVTQSSFRAQMAWLHNEGYKTINDNDLNRLLLEKKQIPGKNVIITFDDGYYSLYEYALPIMSEYGFTATLFLSTGYIGNEYDLHDFEFVRGDRQLTWEEIRTLSANGWSIQSHGVTHVKMNVMDEETLAREFTISKNVIEQNLGKPVDAFAFTYGLYNKRMIDQLKLAGYIFAYTVHSGKLSPGVTRYRIPRIEVNNMDTMETFKTKVTTGYISPKNEFRSKLRDIIYANATIKDFLEKWTPMLGIGNR